MEHKSHDNVIGSTVNGVCQALRTGSVPVHWGEVEQFNNIEEVSFFAFNKVNIT